MNRNEILGTAKSHISRDREATHGKPENSFGRIAGLWSALLGHDVNAGQVALMLSCLKIARAWGNPAHADNWIDLAGYAACGGEIATSTKTPKEGLPFDVVKAERDAARAAALADMAEGDAPLEWPAAPVGTPPEGLGDVSATHTAKSAEGTPAARVCGTCDNRGGFTGRCLINTISEEAVPPFHSCDMWRPNRSDLASLAARDATAWQGQDSGVE